MYNVQWPMMPHYTLTIIHFTLTCQFLKNTLQRVFLLPQAHEREALVGGKAEDGSAQVGVGFGTDAVLTPAQRFDSLHTRYAG